MGPPGPPEKLAQKEMKSVTDFNSWNTVNTQLDATKDMYKTEGASPYRTMSRHTHRDDVRTLSVVTK